MFSTRLIKVCQLSIFMLNVSVVEPESDFLAGAGEKLRAVAVWLRGTVVANQLVNLATFLHKL